MTTWYKKSQSDPLGLGLKENEYRADVRIKSNKLGPNGDWEANIDEKTNFIYNIELDERIWGIKDINIWFSGLLNVTMVITYFDQNGDPIKEDTKPLSIDLSKIPVDYVNGYGISVTDIDIELTPTLEVDYDSSSITVSKAGAL